MINTRLSVALAWLLPVLLVVGLYWPVVGYQFVWDDHHYLDGQLPFHDGLSLWRWAFEPFLDYFRPIPLLLLGAEQLLWRGPSLPHGLNLLWHLGNVLMLMALLNSLCRRAGIPDITRHVSLMAVGLIYGLHPALIESVAWTSARFDLMSTFFALLALWLHLAMPRTSLRLFAVGTSAGVAMLCKEMAFVLVLLLPLADAFISSVLGQRQKDVMTYVVLAFVAALIIGVRLMVIGGNMPVGQLGDASLIQHALIIFKTLGSFLQLAVWPFEFVSPLHPYSQPLHWLDGQILIGIAVLLCLVACLARQSRPYGAMLFLVALLPAMNVVPLDIQDNLIQDRYLTFPLALGLIALTLSLARVLPNSARPLLLAGIFCVVGWLVLAGISIKRHTPIWENDRALWTSLYQSMPDSRIAGNNLQQVYFLAGQMQEVVALTEQRLIQREGDLEPRQALVYADALAEVARAEDALSVLGQLASRTPRDEKLLLSDIQMRSGNIFLNVGDLPQAQMHLRESLKNSPDQTDALYYLAVACGAMGDDAEALSLLSQAVKAVEAGRGNQMRAGYSAAVASTKLYASQRTGAKDEQHISP